MAVFVVCTLGAAILQIMGAAEGKMEHESEDPEDQTEESIDELSEAPPTKQTGVSPQPPSSPRALSIPIISLLDGGRRLAALTPRHRGPDTETSTT